MGEQFVGGSEEVFGGEEVDCALDVDYDQQRERVNEEDVTDLVGHYELALQEPLLEVPQLADAVLAEGGDDQLRGTEATSADVLLRHIIDVPHHILPGLDLLQMMGIVMYLDPPIPASRNQQPMLIIVHQNGNLLPVG